MIPEEQNTRGRKMHKPETSIQSLGILSSKPLSQICPFPRAFPIFTRSGEVEVEIVKISDAVIVTEGQLKQISDFQRYIFRNVLSLEKDPMLLVNSCKVKEFGPKFVCRGDTAEAIDGN